MEYFLLTLKNKLSLLIYPSLGYEDCYREVNSSEESESES